MAKKQYLERYMLIIQKVRKGICTLREIENYLDLESELRETDLRISKRTFQRDINEIRSLYDIDIQYDFSKKGYFIEDETPNHSNIRMIEAFDIFNVMQISENLNEFIHFEERIPKGTEHFYTLLQSIKRKQKVKIGYLKFGEDVAAEKIIKPYALKEFKGRWYLIGVEDSINYLKTFGLDRIVYLEMLTRTFMADHELDVKNKFRNSFGIISLEDILTEEIVLSFSSDQGKYILSYPLHPSQKLIAENQNEVRVWLYIQITHDFVMEVLSFGSSVKIISPLTLIEEVKTELMKSLSQY